MGLGLGLGLGLHLSLARILPKSGARIISVSSVDHKSVPNLAGVMRGRKLQKMKREKDKEIKEERDLVLSPSEETS